MLTRTLRNLESTGLIARRVTKSRTISVEYSLTQLGRTIIYPLRGYVPLGKAIQQAGEC
jgi:DNA-binding HxlR family transcriptional regulator